MNKEDFLNQKVSDLSVEELEKAIRYKQKLKNFKEFDVGDILESTEGVSKVTALVINSKEGIRKELLLLYYYVNSEWLKLSTGYGNLLYKKIGEFPNYKYLLKK